MDRAGNVLLTGWYYPKLSISGHSVATAGKGDIFLEKFDENGNLLWIKTGKGTSVDKSVAIATDYIGNIYIAGHSMSSELNWEGTTVSGLSPDKCYFMKLSQDGNLIWYKMFRNYEIKALCTDLHGNVFVGGDFIDSVYVGYQFFNTITDYKDILILKYSYNGRFIGSNEVVGNGHESLSGINCTPSGSLIVTGKFASCLGAFIPGRKEFVNILKNHYGLKGGSYTSDEFFVAGISIDGYFDWLLSTKTETASLMGQGINAGIVDASGKIYVSGFSRQKAIFGNDTIKGGPFHGTPFIAIIDTGFSMVGYKSAAKNNHIVFPNPVIDYVGISGLNDRPAQVTIVDATGAQVFRDHNYHQGNYMNMAGLTKGLYFVRITFGKETSIKKLVVE